MTDHEFSARASHYLHEAGWTPTRSVPIDEYLEELRQAGYEVPESARRFFQSFGGLLLAPGAQEEMRLDPPPGMGKVSTRRIATYVPRVGKKLVPIGTADRGWQLLMMDSDGVVYSGNDEWLARVADSGPVAIDLLLTDPSLPDAVDIP
ncbi:MAG TPA: SUKH-3 domain-containing protein [Planctomycetota bacterium]|nr:SUKH-3 domain-containing protein [Planctomycetota bacterium]